MRLLLRLLHWMRPYRWRFAAGLACVVLSTAINSLIPTLLKQAIDALGSGAGVTAVVRIGATMVAVTLTMAFFRFQMREILNGVSRIVETDLRDAAFARCTTLDAAWYGRTRTGEVMARLTNDLGAVRMAVGPAIMYLTNTIFGALFALAYMVQISPRLTLLALLPMVPLPWVMWTLGRATHDRFERVQAQFGDLTTMTQEHLSGVRVVRAYAQEEAETARFAALSDEYLARNMRLARLNALFNPSFTLLAGLGAAVVLGVGGGMVLDGRMSVGTFVAFGLYLANLTWPLIALGWVTNLFQRGARIGVADLLEGEAPAAAGGGERRPGRAGIAQRRLGVEDVEDATHRGGTALEEVRDPPERDEGPGQVGEVEAERHEGPDAHPPVEHHPAAHAEDDGGAEPGEEG
ncbi:MAG: hypothetical protein RLZZ467_564, partial [Gemmatimonadota bacterium]